MADRINREQLREMLLAAGVQVLLEEGMGCGLDHLTFPKVFDRIQAESGRRITRASVYDRLWDNQEAFQWDVLVRLIDNTDTIEKSRRRILKIAMKADLSSEAGRLRGLHDICLFAVKQHVNESSRRQDQRIIMAAIGAVASSESTGNAPEGAARVRDALQRHIEQETDAYIELYGEIGLRLGFRLRDPLELRQFVLAIHAFGDAIAMRLNFFPEYDEPIQVPIGDPGGDTYKGSLAGFGVETIALGMLELDPDWIHPDDRPADTA